MAKVTPGENLPGRGKSLRGRVVFRTCRGLLLAQKWPRPRGKPKTPEHQAQVNWFSQAQKLAKRADPQTQITIMQQTAGSPLMPRDLATSLMAGRAYSVLKGPANWIRSRRAMTDVSQSLDVVSNVPGDTLVRGVSNWAGVPLPSTGQTWSIPAPEIFWTSVGSTSAYAWKGNTFRCNQSIAIGMIGAIFDLVATATYRAAIAILDDDEEIQAVAYSNPQTPGRTGREFLAFPLAAALSVDERVALMVGRTDASATYGLPTTGAPNVWFALPVRSQTYARMQTTLPAIGQVVDVGTTGANSVFPRCLF